jgi:hypothetical protein
MSDFKMKEWLDQHVVPLLAGTPPLRIYHPFWNGMPPKDVLVVLMAGDASENHCTQCHQPKGGPTPGCDEGCTYGDNPFDPTAWPTAVKRILDTKTFRFDFTREQIAISHEGGLFNAFGGDGAPLFSPDGMASCRLFGKMSDGIGLIAQIACQYKPTAELGAGEHAAAATKAFYGLFDESPLEVCQKYGAIFGQA